MAPEHKNGWSITFIIRNIKNKITPLYLLGRTKLEDLENVSKGGINRQVMHY